jgi:hypothetical protein
MIKIISRLIFSFYHIKKQDTPNPMRFQAIGPGPSLPPIPDPGFLILAPRLGPLLDSLAPLVFPIKIRSIA